MVNPNKVGLVFGLLIGGWHLFWALLVLVGGAQQLLDFVFWAHMIQPPYSIRPFDPKAAITLITITFLIGYAFGFIGALIWTRVHQPK